MAATNLLPCLKYEEKKYKSEGAFTRHGDGAGASGITLELLAFLLLLEMFNSAKGRLLGDVTLNQ